MYVTDTEVIGIGCKRETAAWWREHYKAVGRAEGYTDSQVAEYANWIEIAAKWQQENAACFEPIETKKAVNA